MMRKVVGNVIVLALVPISLSAQGRESASERIRAAQERAAQAGVPVELVGRKVAEGRAKGVAEERIAAAVERREAALVRARAAMARGEREPSEAELSAGADAVEAGVDASALRTVIEQARAGDGPVAVAVLGELVRQGLPVDRALEAVQDAMDQGEDALASLPARTAARRGRPEGVGRPAGLGGPAGAIHGPPAGLPPAGLRPGAGGRPGGPGGRPDAAPLGGI